MINRGSLILIAIVVGVLLVAAWVIAQYPAEAATLCAVAVLAIFIFLFMFRWMWVRVRTPLNRKSGQILAVIQPPKSGGT